MPLNLNQLRVFQAVCQAGSITAAARGLRVSQPAASRQLAELEANLGVQLVERLPRGIRLTAGGEMLSRHACKLFAEEREAERSIEQLLGLKRGNLVVGASTTAGNYWVPRLLSNLYRRHPQLTIEVSIGNTAEMRRAVLGGEVDLGLTDGASTAEGLEGEVFARDELALIVAPDHPLARNLPVEGLGPNELSAMAFIMREPGSGTRDIVERAFERLGSRVVSAMSLGSTEAIKTAVIEGVGAAWLPRRTVHRELASGQLRELHVRGLRIEQALRIERLERSQPSPAGREFVRLLLGHQGERGDQGTSPTPSL